MSSEKGNVSRTRPQRYQNAHAFRNDKYDTSARRKVGGPGTPLHRHRTGLAPPLPALRWAGPDRLAGGRGDAAAGATSLEAAERSGVEAAGGVWWCLATKERREVAVACWAYRRLRSSGLSLCGLLLEGLRDQKRSRTAVGARRPLRFSGGETFGS